MSSGRCDAHQPKDANHPQQPKRLEAGRILADLLAAVPAAQMGCTGERGARVSAGGSGVEGGGWSKQACMQGSLRSKGEGVRRTHMVPLHLWTTMEMTRSTGIDETTSIANHVRRYCTAMILRSVARGMAPWSSTTWAGEVERPRE